MKTTNGQHLKSPWDSREAEASSSPGGMWPRSQSMSASTSRSGCASACTDSWYCRAHRFTCSNGVQTTLRMLTTLPVTALFEPASTHSWYCRAHRFTCGTHVSKPDSYRMRDCLVKHSGGLQDIPQSPYGAAHYMLPPGGSWHASAAVRRQA